MATTYKIGEAAALLNLKTYVLRFWETEFPEIVPLRTEKGQRLYTEGHLALLERIRYLLHERGLTIGGARRALAEEKARGAVYVFGTPSSVAGGARQDSLVLDPVEESEDATADEEQDFEPPAIAPLHQAGVKQRPQYNLPGLEQIVALREAVAAATAIAPAAATALEPAPGAGLGDGAEQQPITSPEAGPSAQGILPLFAMVRSAFLAGKAAGASLPGKGGDNFIQTGVDSVQAAAPGMGGAPGTEGVCACAPETVRLLIEELEQVARILRAERKPLP